MSMLTLLSSWVWISLVANFMRMEWYHIQNACLEICFDVNLSTLDIVHNSTIPGCIFSIIRDNIALLYFQMLIYRVFRHFTPPLQSPLNYLNCIRVWICVWCALYTSRTMYAVPTEIAWKYDFNYIKYSKSPKSTRLRLRRKQ